MYNESLEGRGKIGAVTIYYGLSLHLRTLHIGLGPRLDRIVERPDGVGSNSQGALDLDPYTLGRLGKGDEAVVRRIYLLASRVEKLAVESAHHCSQCEIHLGPSQTANVSICMVS